jgi:hypothetical protein
MTFPRRNVKQLHAFVMLKILCCCGRAACAAHH